MFGQILGGLPDPIARTRLRQHQREVGRVVERPRGCAIGVRVIERIERRLGADHAVVVLDLVGQLQGTARLALRILGECNRGRMIGNGGELPNDIPRGSAMHARGSSRADDEAALLGTLRVDGLRPALRLSEPSTRGHGKVNAACADDENAAGWNGNSPGRLHRLARAQALQDQRRPSGISGRADPGVDAEIRRDHHALPVEGCGKPLHPLASGRDERCDHQHYDQSAKSNGIAQREPWHWRSRFERLGCP